MANESTEPALGGRFNLMRYFTLASAVAMVGVALLSALTFGALMRHALVQEDEADAVAVAQHIAKEFNAELDALLQTEVPLRWDAPQVQGRLSETFTRSGGGLGVIKVKVFDATGQIIYSTDLALIGQLDASNPNLQGALAGQVTSKLVRAEKVADLSGETFTVDVIETYVPVSRQPGSPFQVFEIYQDATDLLAQVQEAQRVLAAAVASIMLLIFLLLYLIVRRADQVIARQTTDLQVANTELRRLEQLKSDLTHMIVHDMKSPLTSIMLSAGLLSRVAPLIGKQVGLVERTRRSCQQLLTMISDMLDVTRLEEGKLDLEREAVPMRQVVEPAVQDVAPLIETADKMLHLALPDDLPPLWVDRDLMTRVVGNLLNNAEKHTEPGGNIWVVGQVGPEPGTLNLSVRDDGEGIPAEFHDTIFERFRQAKNQRLGRRTDTGLGLAFCKLAVEAHGGTINVDSDVGQGSTFTLTLPVARANGDS